MKIVREKDDEIRELLYKLKDLEKINGELLEKNNQCNILKENLQEKVDELNSIINEKNKEINEMKIFYDEKIKQLNINYNSSKEDLKDNYERIISEY